MITANSTQEERIQYIKDILRQPETIVRANRIHREIHEEKNVDTLLFWGVDAEGEKFITFTDYGTYTHHYNWDLSFEENFKVFMEESLEFYKKSKEEKTNGNNN